MKERVVGRKYDPLVWLGAKIGRRPRHDTPAVPGAQPRHARHVRP
jgi:succinate dehydrogenase / fumarate reductase iron-sulfur subunit